MNDDAIFQEDNEFTEETFDELTGGKGDE